MLIVTILSFVEWWHEVHSVHVRMSFSHVCTAKCTLCIAFWLLILHTSEPSILFTTLVWMLIVIILSLVEKRHGWGAFCACEDWISHVRQSLHFFYSFLALNFSHICEPSNLFTTLVLMPISHNSEFRWVATWLRCILYMWGWAFHMYSKVYTFHSFLALNSSHIIREPSKLFTTLVWMLIVIILSFVE